MRDFLLQKPNINQRIVIRIVISITRQDKTNLFQISQTFQLIGGNQSIYHFIQRGATC